MAQRTRSQTTIAVGVFGVVGLLVLGVVAGQIGGASIRGTAVQIETLAFSVPAPVAVGLPTTVRWDPGENDPEARLFFLIRDSQEEHAVGQALLGEGLAVVIVPCAFGGQELSLVARSQDTDEVIGQRPVQLLAAGRDCAVR